MQHSPLGVPQRNVLMCMRDGVRVRVYGSIVMRVCTVKSLFLMTISPRYIVFVRAYVSMCLCVCVCVCVCARARAIDAHE